jgi:hypothetical protein
MPEKALRSFKARLAPLYMYEVTHQKNTGRTSIVWLKERISQHYAVAKDTEVERGKHSIIPPPPKKSFLDSAPNRLSRTIVQIRAGR